MFGGVGGNLKLADGVGFRTVRAFGLSDFRAFGPVTGECSVGPVRFGDLIGRQKNSRKSDARSNRQKKRGTRVPLSDLATEILKQE
jgi:hypothetical protein